MPLTGTNIIAITTVSVCPATPLNYQWKEHGLKLYAPANAMDPQTPPLNMSIQALNSNHFQLPENMELVSGVYSVTFPQRAIQPVTLELQHCASLEHPHQLSSLIFITAKSTQGEPPYHFQPQPEGLFLANTSHGNLQLSHSSEVAIVNDGSTKTYRALTYYIPQSATSWLVHFIIIWDLDLYLQVCCINIIVFHLFIPLCCFAAGCKKSLHRRRCRGGSYSEDDLCRRRNKAGHS